ncbi:hypothetical protein EVAR_65832_1 [Eumeta japonica]|uniref:Uncharacterized protein n=1 Tax=Eumeta variegata TaxID=151549 RepID=A0A4C1ZPL5_EUMVA|nr:hypothetical protein EVAR_65832_1 [Eumeta japonica]
MVVFPRAPSATINHPSRPPVPRSPSALSESQLRVCRRARATGEPTARRLKRATMCARDRLLVFMVKHVDSASNECTDDAARRERRALPEPEPSGSGRPTPKAFRKLARGGAGTGTCNDVCQMENEIGKCRQGPRAARTMPTNVLFESGADATIKLGRRARRAPANKYLEANGCGRSSGAERTCARWTYA